jgi:hypothetical protein
MDADEKKPGGGAGGGDKDHADFRDVHGLFERDADAIRLFTHDESPSGGIAIFASGSSGRLALVGLNQVNVASSPEPTNFGAMSSGQYPDPFTGKGVLIWACGDNDKILIQRGAMSSPINQSIALLPSEIVVDAGSLGTITLKAGNSYIKIEPSGITINGTLVQIN